MVHLVSSDVFALLSIVISILVLLYVAGYAVMSYLQAKRGALRPDWSVSVIFYVGIIILALGYLAEVTHACLGSVCFNTSFDAAYFVSLILFVYGFERRSGAAVKITTKLRRVKAGLNRK